MRKMMPFDRLMNGGHRPSSHAGIRLEVRRGKPILTFFAEGSTVADCWVALKGVAADLDRWLFGG